MPKTTIIEVLLGDGSFFRIASKVSVDQVYQKLTLKAPRREFPAIDCAGCVIFVER